MRAIGVDVGTKHVGIATGDTETKIAIPKEEVAASNAVARLVELAQKEEAELFVIGRPARTELGEQPVALLVDAFASRLAHVSGKKIAFIDEQYSSQIARHAHVGKEVHHANPHYTLKEKVNKEAAAIILQRYLDRQ